MTIVSALVSLVPGSIVVEARRRAGILYVHGFHVTTPQELEELRRDVLAVETRVVRAIGTPEEIARATEAFRVRVERQPLGEDDYTMDHTSGVFLFRADGSFSSIIDYHEDRAVALPKIRRVLT